MKAARKGGARRPAVALAAEAIRERIADGRYAAGAFLASEHLLAAELDVSRGTVRAAIDLLVGTGELTRRPHARPVVGLAPERAESRPGPEGSGLDVYVWVSHPISDGGSLLFMKGVSLGLQGTPYRMIAREPTRFYGDYVRLDERQFLLDLLADDGAAGAILDRDAFADNADVFEALQRAGKRLVFVDTPPPKDFAGDYVSAANEASARRCVEHLIERGHREIAFLAERGDCPVCADRARGYRRAMAGAGLPTVELSAACLPPTAVPPPPPAGRFAARTAPSGSYLEWSHRLVRAVLALDRRPTALFADCDVLAHSVGGLLEGAGLRIPEDVALVGFDGLARWDGGPDDLTTAHQDYEGFGWHAAELLLERLGGGAGAPPRHLLLPAPLHVRASSDFRPDVRPVGELPGNVAL